jgi:hypothetical protein
MTALTLINLYDNKIGADGAETLAHTLQSMTALTTHGLGGNKIAESTRAVVEDLLVRNKRLRALFLFDARQMLLTLLSPGACGVLWPYFVADVTDGVEAPDDIEELRAVYAAIVKERRLRAAPVTDDAGKGGSHAVKRRRTKR